MRKKILIAVIVLVLVVAGIGTGVAFWQNGQSGGGQQTAQEKDKDKKDKEEQKKEDGEEELTPEEAQEALEEQLAANTYVDQGGVKATGTSASESFSIRMSKLCTFSDPAGLSFDKRYVLYGGSDCTPARRAGKDCIGAYEILYVKNGKPVGEYMCYVMNSESAAKSVVQKFSGYNGDGGRVGRWGDVAYVYSTGAYVQTSIDTYYKAGSIKEATPEAYLGMQFYFRE